jgi:hypothetical protein
VKARSANAKPDDNCEIHPLAKVPHTNGECRQNEANPKFKLKFKKRERGEEAVDQKVTKQKYDSSQKVLFIEEEESDIEEIYLTEDKKVLCDTNNMLGVGFSPNKNLCIKIPRQAESTATQVEDERMPLTYAGLRKWHEKDRKEGRHFLESSSDEEECLSSDCISMDSDELFHKTGIERWPKPTSRLLQRNEHGDYIDMPSPYVEPAAVTTDDEHYLHDMAYLANLTMEIYGEDAKPFDQVMADHPMEFEWSDRHELLPDGGWKVAHEEEQGKMSPAASISEQECDAI